jgi:hypothetical protein
MGNGGNRQGKWRRNKCRQVRIGGNSVRMWVIKLVLHNGRIHQCRNSNSSGTKESVTGQPDMQIVTDVTKYSFAHSTYS